MEAAACFDGPLMLASRRVLEDEAVEVGDKDDSATRFARLRTALTDAHIGRTRSHRSLHIAQAPNLWAHHSTWSLPVYNGRVPVARPSQRSESKKSLQRYELACAMRCCQRIVSRMRPSRDTCACGRIATLHQRAVSWAEGPTAAGEQGLAIVH